MNVDPVCIDYIIRFFISNSVAKGFDPKRSKKLNNCSDSDCPYAQASKAKTYILASIFFDIYKWFKVEIISWEFELKGRGDAQVKKDITDMLKSQMWQKIFRIIYSFCSSICDEPWKLIV